jgi:signal peptidase I
MEEQTIVNYEATRSSTPVLLELWDWTKSILVALAIVLALNQFVFNLSTVKGHSMDPTLQDGEWLFINKLSYQTGLPERGDVVVFKDPDPNVATAQRKFLVKRVVAVPGDIVEISRGRLYLNGKAMEESYTEVRTEPDYGPAKVGLRQYFVLGDNRRSGASKDSRSFGAVPLEAFEGRVQAILWPPPKISFIAGR